MALLPDPGPAPITRIKTIESNLLGPIYTSQIVILEADGTPTPVGPVSFYLRASDETRLADTSDYQQGVDALAALLG